jgi:hypothetical protein
MAEPVRIGSYFDVVEASLARARLEAEGITARVLEPAGFNPLLNDAAGGITLEVSAGDARRARAVLKEMTASHQEDEDEDVTRCPRCELQYCAHERPGLRGAGPGAANILIAIGSLFHLLGPKRWRCHKCGHVWDDAKAGPKRITRLDAGAPRPVFRLRRTSAGMGLFLGLIVGLFAWLLIGEAPGAVVFLIAAVAGWFLGSTRTRHVCSEPSCRAALAPGAEECGACGGSVAGEIQRAPEHFSAAADFRREVAATREPPYRDPPRKRRAEKARRSA